MPTDMVASHGAERSLGLSIGEMASILFALDASAIVAITDRAGRITYANESFCRVSKYSREELVGRDHRAVNSGYHPKAFFEGLWRTIAEGRVWRGEIRNRVKDGTNYWVDTTIVPVAGDDGRPELYVSIGYDVTERKRLEAELVRAAQTSLLGELAAGLAHEIKNPLAGIQGAVDILLRRRAADDPEREALEGVRREVARIDATLRAILDRARPPALDRDAAPLAEAIRRAVARARDRAELMGARVAIDLARDSDELVLPFDATQIEAAVFSLVMNAIEAIEGDGGVAVRLRADGAAPDGAAVVEVEDTGRGIPAEDLPRVFQPFFTTKAGGTGLGLAAVQRIVRAHGGRVEVASEPGRGSVFMVRLPLRGRA